MKLTQEIKRVLDALAYANCGDYLSPRQKAAALTGVTPWPVATEPAPTPTPRAQVGLYLGSELTPDIVQYVAQTCARLGHGLTVFTFISEGEVEALLKPLRPLLEASGTPLRLCVLAGEPPRALIVALRRRPEVAFLVCNGAGYFAHGLLSGNPREGRMPVPVVMVASQEGAALQQAPARVTGAQRAA